ncbi:hypothetical protein S7711_10491 [Stachybotrys chartarum IBT 7711]|uniref:Fungal N-terminal domain-containing protein n=1 Tax=Stachybotrys chartarum (strain CBS 109288 / IBT 7711) TaxID=1280523 RepID=A0A084BCA1_STACB|nr:hypothetical protein S7711_10491 [Stachybotrys chartarum IBT 7711]
MFTTTTLLCAQLLNYLSSSTAKSRSTENALLNIQLERLRQCVRIISRVGAEPAQDLRWVAQGGCDTWPQVRPGTDTALRREGLWNRLKADHEDIR